MNERIRELAEQTKQFMDGSDDLDTFIEKFAELFVRESISALDDADGSVHHSKCLLEHFGVEDE
jgi:hypothetical protein